MSYNTGFINRKIKELPTLKFQTLQTKGVLPQEEYTKADDWEVIVIEGCEDTKYARYMYSKSLERLRHQTIGEFYGAGIVD